MLVGALIESANRTAKRALQAKRISRIRSCSRQSSTCWYVALSLPTPHGVFRSWLGAHHLNPHSLSPFALRSASSPSRRTSRCATNSCAWPLPSSTTTASGLCGKTSPFGTTLSLLCVALPLLGVAFALLSSSFNCYSSVLTRYLYEKTPWYWLNYLLLKRDETPHPITELREKLRVRTLPTTSILDHSQTCPVLCDYCLAPPRYGEEHLRLHRRGQPYTVALRGTFSLSTFFLSRASSSHLSSRASVAGGGADQLRRAVVESHQERPVYVRPSPHSLPHRPTRTSTWRGAVCFHQCSSSTSLRSPKGTRRTRPRRRRSTSQARATGYASTCSVLSAALENTASRKKVRPHALSSHRACVRAWLTLDVACRGGRRRERRRAVQPGADSEPELLRLPLARCDRGDHD